MAVCFVAALQTQVKVIKMFQEFVYLYGSLFLTRRFLVADTSAVFRNIG